MEPVESRYVDKTSWGPGPWQEESDKVEWRHPDNGLPCLIVRGGGGALCGYVACPPGHPFYGADGYAGEPEQLRVHGGITFGDKCAEDGRICHVARPGEPDDVWWLGFDCGHYNDIRPEDAGLMYRYLRARDGIYRSIDYVREQVESLAVQIFVAGEATP